VLGSTLHFSEYILYGAYVEFVVGNAAKHYFDAQDLCHCSWHHNVEDRASLEAFLKKIGPHHVAVLVQSNLGMNLVNPLEGFDVPPLPAPLHGTTA
jgi:hypothetical protein